MKNLLVVAVLLLSVEAFCQGQYQKESAGSLGYVSGQAMQLADAIPADKYSYTPQQGVRTTAQVYAHIISANYFFASKLGAKIPADVKMETLEMDLKTKELVTAELKRSYALVIEAIKNAKDADLSKKVELPFPGDFTGMSVIMIIVNHSYEHVGQLVAYARANSITPPWSASN